MLNQVRTDFVQEAYKRFGEYISIAQADEVSEALGQKSSYNWMKKYSAGRNTRKLPLAEAGVLEGPAALVVPNATVAIANTESTVIENVVSIEEAAKPAPSVLKVVQNLIPKRDALFVPFGFAKQLEKIFKSGRFFPTFITGLSGNGKTYMIEQVAAKLGRKLIRTNITVETDEDDLIGGFRLVNGETMFFKGPVIKAMEEGAILLLDEIDLGHPSKIMCLQSILEGASYFIKKTGETVAPAKGFTIVGTANTKGKGSEDGRFIGTNVLNEAFLERFTVTVEQEYPALAVEKKILSKVFESLDLPGDSTFIDKLTMWAETIRKTFYAGGVDEIISTRRLVHIANTFAVFGDRYEAVELCLNRFDDATKESFLSLYSATDEEAVAVTEPDDASGLHNGDDLTPF